ncbi:MAG: acyltransferase, partial [Candidatus Macondimonas sp.]
GLPCDMRTELNPFLSQKFRFWSFVSMFLLVFLHGYNVEPRYLQPWTTPTEPLTATGFVEYLLANGLLRFRIPMLFIISGYLFALHDEQPHRQRVRKRLRTLLAPYLIWSAFGILLTFVLELHPIMRSAIASSHVAQIDDTRMFIHDHRWYEIAMRWLFFPVSYQLWFIRVLLIYNLAYPLIVKAVMHRTARHIFFSFAVLFWLATFNLVLLEGEGILFFSLGVWIQKTDFAIETPRPWLNPRGWFIAFVGLAVLKTWLAFRGQSLLGNSVYPLITLLHKGTVIGGLIACWYGGDAIVRWCMARPWFAWLSAFSFMIFALHAPLVAYLIDPTIEALQPVPAARLLAFILLPLAVIALCVAAGAALRRATPGFYGLLTGGRGMGA